MAAKFVNVLESEIDQFKKNAVPQKTKDATKFGVKLFKDRLIKFTVCSFTFFRSKCRQLLVTFANILSHRMVSSAARVRK